MGLESKLQLHSPLLCIKSNVILVKSLVILCSIHKFKMKWKLGQLYSNSVSSVQSLSHVWLFATPRIAARQASLSITNSWSSLKLTSIESVMLSSHLILWTFLSSPSPPAHNPSQHQSLFQWVNSSHEVSKVHHFQFAFSYCHGVLKARILKWFAVSFHLGHIWCYFLALLWCLQKFSFCRWKFYKNLTLHRLVTNKILLLFFFSHMELREGVAVLMFSLS